MTRKAATYFATLGAALLGWLPTGTAQAEPLWELGLGASAISFPAYPGSAERAEYLLPMPYFVYRGERIDVDRDGFRGRLLERDYWELNISVNGAVPVDSDDIPLREGMADLDPLLEIGPTLTGLLYRWPGGSRVRLQLPVRAALAVDIDLGGVEYVGLRSNPHINLDWRHRSGWRLGFNVGPWLATRPLHQFYYGVGQDDATRWREAYDAPGGYGGGYVLVSATRRFSNHWIGGFARYDYLSGAVFADSPLVETDHVFMVGVAVARVFAESARRAPPDSRPIADPPH